MTPLTPADWKLTFDGETVSLYPSIGNWNFPCRSHYWLTKNRIEWAPGWEQEDRIVDKTKLQADDNGNEVYPAGYGFWQSVKQRWSYWTRK